MQVYPREIHGYTGKGEKIDSVFSVDAQLIGSVTATDKESFDMVIEKQLKLLKNGVYGQLRNAAKLCASLVKL